MKNLYKICGLYTECDFHYPVMTRRSEKYLCSEEHVPDISVPFLKEDMKNVLAENPTLSQDDCEIIATTRFFYMKLLNFDGFMLHSSAVVVDNKAYLFSAPSGTGKSTHTEQWLKLFGDRAYILNDDKPAILIKGNEVFAAGTPWSGKSDLNRNEILPLQGICVLSRSEDNWIKPLTGMQAIFGLLNQTLRPTQSEGMDKLMSLIDACITTVPVWQMGCNISTEAAKLSHAAMSGNTHDTALRS